MLPTHAHLTFAAGKSNGNAIVSIRKDVDEDTADVIEEFFDKHFKRNGKFSQWIIKADEAHDICVEVDRVIEDFDNEEDESDDELIQEALKRRYKSKSTGKVINAEEVEDSDVEHVTSVCRRLRHIYSQHNVLLKMIMQLTARVEELER